MTKAVTKAAARKHPEVAPPGLSGVGTGAGRQHACLPSPSDWSFELIETYHNEIARTAKSFGLDTYPVQLEVITAEQMIDAYASVGMPVNYRHWSFGKQFIATEKITAAARWGWPMKS